MAILQMTINVDETCDIQQFSRLRGTKGNWIVDWGDGCIEVNREVHYYTELGSYQITIRGDFELPRYRAPRNIISLDKEEGCGIVDLCFCFGLCPKLTSVPHDWDVSQVTDMRCTFEDCEIFNQDLSHWNLKEVATMSMFTDCPIEEKHKPKGIE